MTFLVDVEAADAVVRTQAQTLVGSVLRLAELERRGGSVDVAGLPSDVEEFLSTEIGKSALAAWVSGASRVLNEFAEVFERLEADDAHFSSDALDELAEAAAWMLASFYTDMRAAKETTSENQ